jgi:hypothetical protein
LGAISISSYIQIEGWMNGYAGRHGWGEHGAHTVFEI